MNGRTRGMRREAQTGRAVEGSSFWLMPRSRSEWNLTVCRQVTSTVPPRFWLKPLGLRAETGDSL